LPCGLAWRAGKIFIIREIDSRKRSRFITAAIKRLLKKEKAQRLAQEYKEAAEDIRKTNQDL
jgi:hypothetical protein